MGWRITRIFHRAYWLPAPFLCHLRFLNYKFSLLVLLGLLKSLLLQCRRAQTKQMLAIQGFYDRWRGGSCPHTTYVFPAKYLLAAAAVYVGNGVQSRYQKPVFSRPQSHVDNIVEEVSPPMPPLESLGDDFVMVRRVATAIAAAVYPRSVQVLLEQSPHGYFFQTGAEPPLLFLDTSHLRVQERTSPRTHHASSFQNTPPRFESTRPATAPLCCLSPL